MWSRLPPSGQGACLPVCAPLRTVASPVQLLTASQVTMLFPDVHVACMNSLVYGECTCLPVGMSGCVCTEYRQTGGVSSVYRLVGMSSCPLVC